MPIRYFKLILQRNIIIACKKVIKNIYQSQYNVVNGDNQQTYEDEKYENQL